MEFRLTRNETTEIQHSEGSKFPFGTPFWAPSWNRLGALLGRLAGLLGRLGALLGRLGAICEASWAVLGRSWAVFGRFWGPLGPSWDDLWSLLGRFRPSLARKCENPKNLRKPKENQ